MLVTNGELDLVLRFYSAPSGGDKRSGLQGLHNGLVNWTGKTGVS